MVSCTAAGNPVVGAPSPTVPIRISTVSSLIPSNPPVCEGTFSYRGVAYRIEIDGCAEKYAGTGQILGLERPEAIAGDYAVEPGGTIWRNLKNDQVALDISPPLKTAGNRKHLQLYYSGATLPRQP
jgi:hypothetical protein